MEIKEANVTTQPIAAISASEDTFSILQQWRSAPEHSAYDHLIYTLARAAWTAHNDNLTDTELRQLAIRKLARAFSPKAGRFACLERHLLQATRSTSYDLVSNEEQADEVKQLALTALMELRMSAAPFSACVAPTPPPRPKKPYVRG